MTSARPDPQSARPSGSAAAADAAQQRLVDAMTPLQRIHLALALGRRCVAVQALVARDRASADAETRG